MRPPGLDKSPTGIPGLDEIPVAACQGRTTIVCGGPGCGKTMLGIEFLVRGATDFNEPGVLMAFEETPAGHGRKRSLPRLRSAATRSRKKNWRSITSTSSPPKFRKPASTTWKACSSACRHAVDSIGAKRVDVRHAGSSFRGFSNPGILRAEFRRLFRWLKDRGLTTVMTAERGEGTLTRHGLEEYVSDCVILLDHRIKDQISARRMRIVKYRGTKHGADEYPFLIDEGGMSILPLTS